MTLGGGENDLPEFIPPARVHEGFSWESVPEGLWLESG